MLAFVTWAAFLEACGDDVGISATDAGTADASDAGNAADTAFSDVALDIRDAATVMDVAPPPYPPDGACEPQLVEAGPSRSPCSFTASEVACDASTQCRVLTVVSCCGSEFVGVNATSHARCPTPPCPPLTCPDVDAGGGPRTEYCEPVPSYSDVAVACVAGRCVTYAAVVGSE